MLWWRAPNQSRSEATQAMRGPVRASARRVASAPHPPHPTPPHSASGARQSPILRPFPQPCNPPMASRTLMRATFLVCAGPAKSSVSSIRGPDAWQKRSPRGNRGQLRRAGGGGGAQPGRSPSGTRAHAAVAAAAAAATAVAATATVAKGSAVAATATAVEGSASGWYWAVAITAGAKATARQAPRSRR